MLAHFAEMAVVNQVLEKVLKFSRKLLVDHIKRESVIFNDFFMRKDHRAAWVLQPCRALECIVQAVPVSVGDGSDFRLEALLV